MSKKIIAPLDPLIFKVAGTFAATFYEIGRSQGMPSKYKTPEAYAKRYIEKFVPYAIKHLMEMLKPHSGVSEYEKSIIYEALLNPVNDPQLMDGNKLNGLVDVNAKALSDMMNAYDKNQLKFKNLKLVTPKPSYKNKLLNTANPDTPKA